MDEPLQRTDDDRRIAMDARDWIVRLSSGDVDEETLDRFRHWRDLSPGHHSAFERERLFWHQLQGLEGRAPRQAAPTPRFMGRRAFIAGAGMATAAGVAMLSLPRIEQWWRGDFSTGVGEQAEFALPDGSIAALNTDSTIALNFGADLRLVELLSGEAEFKVKASPSGTPFRVAALGGNSDGLETTFSVRAVDGMATVTVTDGQVRVIGPASPGELNTGSLGGVQLTANEQTSYGEGEAPGSAIMVDAEVARAWRGGRLIFEGRPFSSVMAELGRYLPERIVLGPGVAPQVPVTAIFSTKEVLAAVQALARTQGLTVRRIPGLVVLVS